MKRAEEFKSINMELLGLSIDSHYSHVAWVRNIKEKFGIYIPFPIIADLDMKVAKNYGMIHPGAADTSAVRATFIIDDKGILRAMVYYPMSNGRSIDEFARLVKALQAYDANGVATPENWQPGDSVIIPPPTIAETAKAHIQLMIMSEKHNHKRLFFTRSFQQYIIFGLVLGLPGLNFFT